MGQALNPSTDGRPPTMLIAGPRGVLGRALIDWMGQHHPEVRIARLTPFPFSLTAIHTALMGGGVTYFVNCAGLGSDEESVKQPYQYVETNGFGVLKHLEMIRGYSPATRYLTFGTIYEGDAITPSHSPYPTSKRVMREIVSSYRSTYQLHASVATLGFTEYPNRGNSFLSKKITRGVARIRVAMDRGESFTPLQLRDLDQSYCWTWAGDVAAGVWLMLNQGAGTDWLDEDHVQDYPLITGEEHTVREFALEAFKAAGIAGDVERLMVDTSTDPRTDGAVDAHVSAARTGLGWSPQVSFPELVARMVVHDIAALSASTPSTSSPSQPPTSSTHA